MGPGFDCLGMALDVWNSVRVERHRGPLRIEVSGEGAGEVPDDVTNLVYRSFSLLFEGAGESPPDVRITCDNRIPLGRGLGSSSAAAVAGLVAANEMRGDQLSRLELLEIAARLEGHPDNAAPALFGGCRIVARDDSGELLSAPVPVPDDLMAVLFVPDVAMPTSEARDLLPAEVPRSDAVYNISRAALLVRAFATGDLAHLDVATGDRLHQPTRQAIKQFLPHAQHLPRRPRRRRAGRLPVGSRIQRAGADPGPGVYNWLRNGRHCGQVGRGRLHHGHQAHGEGGPGRRGGMTSPPS